MGPEVVVVGGGPAGSAAAYWLASAGRDVLVVEKKTYPREKTCGDGLTPRAIHQLREMGFDFEVPEFHRIDGLRSYAGDDLYLEMSWPEHPVFPSWGGVIRRADLDAQVAALVHQQGVTIAEGTEAFPIANGGGPIALRLVRDGETEVLRPEVVIVADGSLSRFGRQIGTSRRRDYPLGLAARAYWRSGRAHDRFMESQLDLRDGHGDTVPGYGWVFPLGDGTVNVGVGLLSTFRAWKDINTTDLLGHYAGAAPAHWGLDAEEPLTAPRGGKLSMALSVGPLSGPNWLVVGDAAAAINPWNGEGISLAYETGRMAAEVTEQALQAGDLSVLGRYGDRVHATYGDYYRFARLFVKAIGRPTVMRALAHVGLRSRPLMEWVLRVMANLLEPEDEGTGDEVYRALEAVVRVTPGF